MIRSLPLVLAFTSQYACGESAAFCYAWQRRRKRTTTVYIRSIHKLTSGFRSVSRIDELRVSARKLRLISGTRLPRQRINSIQGDDARNRGVHPPHPHPCAAQRLPPHPPLRPVRQTLVCRQYRPRPPATRSSAQDENPSVDAKRSGTSIIVFAAAAA